MIRTYTVCNGIGTVIASNCSAEEAVDEMLSYDGHAWTILDITDEGECGDPEFILQVSPGGAASTNGHRGLRHWPAYDADTYAGVVDHILTLGGVRGTTATKETTP